MLEHIVLIVATKNHVWIDGSWLWLSHLPSSTHISHNHSLQWLKKAVDVARPKKINIDPKNDGSWNNVSPASNMAVILGYLFKKTGVHPIGDRGPFGFINPHSLQNEGSRWKKNGQTPLRKSPPEWRDEFLGFGNPGSKLTHLPLWHPRHVWLPPHHQPHANVHGHQVHLHPNPTRFDSTVPGVGWETHSTQFFEKRQDRFRWVSFWGPFGPRLPGSILILGNEPKNVYAYIFKRKIGATSSEMWLFCWVSGCDLILKNTTPKARRPSDDDVLIDKGHVGD